jgi:hypothetical protein
MGFKDGCTETLSLRAVGTEMRILRRKIAGDDDDDDDDDCIV